jgi:hypothetical protein
VDSLTRLFWVALPRRLARRSEGLAGLAADGHVLAGLGWLGGLLPPAALAGGVAVGAAHPGFDEAFTESLALMITVVALGVLSSQLGAWGTLGFAAGDFLVAHRAWTTPTQVGFEEPSGLMSNPVLANLVVERVPLLIEYGLLASLAVGLPVAARALAGSVAVRLRLPDGVHLGATTVLVSLTTFVLARFWATAAPLVIRPVFTWTVEDGINQGVPPAGAIVPVQSNATAIARAAVLAVLARTVVTRVLSRRRRRHVDRVEAELLQPLDGSPRRRGHLATLFGAVVASGVGVLFLAGMLTDWWAVGVLGGAFLVARLATSGWLPLPTRRWRDVVERVPVLIRFGGVLLAVNGISRAVAEAVLTSGGGTTEDFQVMVWPIVAAALLTAILVPGPPRRPATATEHPEP